jgi:hypothetical protein
MLNKLKKMKMPASKKAAPEELDLAAGEEMAEEEGEEMPLELPELEAEEGEELAEEGAEMEAEGEEMEPLDLSALSDDELMAELKKRGLMSKMKA